MRRSIGAALLVGALVGGCGTEPPCPECGVIVIASGADADALLPVFADGVGRTVSDQLFLKLADVGLAANTVGDSGFVPRLAESWAFEDDRTLVFRLRADARWHDGTPVTAGDVVFTYAVYRDTVIGSAAGPHVAAIDSVRARDDRTAVFYFARAYPEQFFDATHHMRILPRHLLDSVPRAAWRTHPLARRPVGNGPFRLAEWRPGELIELLADSGFFGGVPGPARLIWRIVPDFNAAVTQLVGQEADFVEAVVGPENVERVEAADHLRLVEYSSTVYIYLGFNLRGPNGRGAHPLFQDRALRRALTVAVNREVIIEAVLGGWGAIPPGPTTAAVWVAEGAAPQLPYDSAEAARQLDALGWRDTDGDGIRDRDGQPLAFDLLYPSSSGIRQRAGVILQEQFRLVGAAVQLMPVEFNVWLDRARAGRFDAILGAWLIDLPPGSMRAMWGTSGIGGSNYDAYASPVFDSLVDRAAETTDPGTARALWHEALQVINDDAPAVWLFSPKTLAGVNRRLTNVTLRPDEWWATVWTWKSGRRQGVGGGG
ncbi:MAG: ABC transporter substrate-binding protein [Gemmatimonadota bacterium]|nr:ABC transporter substrate-binding protein [Gemmatimonadota bacterium]